METMMRMKLGFICFVRGCPFCLMGFFIKIPNLAVHIYGKHYTRIERKMGHITAVDKSLEKAYKKAKLARKLISI